MDFKGTLLSIFVEQLIPVIVTAVGLTLTAAFGYLTVLIKKKADAEGQSATASKGLAILARATELMKNVVAHSEAELRPIIQKAAADGTLIPSEGAEIKAKALEIFKREMGTEGMAALKEVLGGSIDIFLSGLLERVLVSLKIQKAAGEASVP